MSKITVAVLAFALGVGPLGSGPAQAAPPADNPLPPDCVISPVLTYPPMMQCSGDPAPRPVPQPYLPSCAISSTGEVRCPNGSGNGGPASVPGSPGSGPSLAICLPATSGPAPAVIGSVAVRPVPPPPGFAPGLSVGTLPPAPAPVPGPGTLPARPMPAPGSLPSLIPCATTLPAGGPPQILLAAAGAGAAGPVAGPASLPYNQSAPNPTGPPPPPGSGSAAPLPQPASAPNPQAAIPPPPAPAPAPAVPPAPAAAPAEPTPTVPMGAPLVAPSPVPDPRAPAVVPGSSALRTVTDADAGTTLTLRVGEWFALNLPGLSDTTTVEIADPAIVAPVDAVPVEAGPRLFHALAPGSTTLTVTWQPACDPSAGPCDQPAPAFQITIAVE